MNDALARALALFDEYADLPGAELERRLAALAASDPPLHAALRALLEGDRDDDAGVLDRSPAQIVAERQPRANPAADAPTSTLDAQGEPHDEGADLRVGALLGPWRIERILGRGGMGTVYEAHREDGQFQQRVALKCIRSGLESPELAAAFREERNLLARLDHPGIAGVVDGGIDAEGRPWFALRRVDGEPIDAWCDRRRLGLGARVDLLLQACDALAYAHAQGVLHRDIKPSNLLVTGEGRVQLLDFGISTRFDAARFDAGDGAGAQLAITPDYAAPEARRHGTQGPATDLYMLGVLSYRLLCGHWPTRLHGLRELLPIAAGAAPEPMDRLLDGADDELARRRGLADAAALQRALAGDLSAVALKAVAARPQDRYPSVAEFARELRAWRSHRPVDARRAGWRERARMWRRRNPAATAMVAALALVVAGGVVAIGWQHQRAQREARASQSVGRLFASTLGTATLSGLGSAPFSSRALLERTERELRAMPLDDQPGLKARSLTTLARSYALLGDYRRAEALAAEAERTLGEEPDRDGFVAATRLAMLNTQTRYDEAQRQARARIDALRGREDETARASRIVFGAELARAQWHLGRTEQAVATCDELVAQAGRLGRGHEELLAQSLILRSEFLRRLWRAEAAEADARRAMLLMRPLDPVLADDALERYMRARQVSGAPDAWGLAHQLVRHRVATLGIDHPKTAFAMIRAAVFEARGEPCYDIGRALAAIRDAYGPDHPEYAAALAPASSQIARDPAQQRALLRHAVAVLERTRPADSESRLAASFNLAQSLIEAPLSRAPQRERSEGLALLRRNLAAKRAAGVPTQQEAYLLMTTLSDYGDDASLPELQAYWREYAAQVAALFPPGNYRYRHIAFQHAKLLYRQGRREQADREFAGFLDAERGFVALGGRGKGALTDHGNRGEFVMWSLAYRGFYALERCRKAEAVEFLRQAASLADTAPDHSPDIGRAVHAYYDGVRRGALPPVRPQLLREADRERIDRAARACAAAGAG